MPKPFCSTNARRRAELTLFLALLPAAAGACDLGGFDRRVEAGGVTLGFRAATPLAVGSTHALLIGLCGAGSRLVGVDAFMPAHGHGMNYRTEIAALGPDRWRADGLILHMPGRWQLLFDVDTPAGRRRLVTEIELE